MDLPVYQTRRDFLGNTTNNLKCAFVNAHAIIPSGVIIHALELCELGEHLSIYRPIIELFGWFSIAMFDYQNSQRVSTCPAKKMVVEWI